MLPRPDDNAGVDRTTYGPVLAAFGGLVFLNESVSAHLVIATALILGGMTLAVVRRKPTIRI